MRADRRARGFLDGVNAAAIALMIGVAATLGHAAIVDVFTGGAGGGLAGARDSLPHDGNVAGAGGGVVGVVYQLVVQ